MLPASHCVLAGRVRLHRSLAFFAVGAIGFASATR